MKMGYSEDEIFAVLVQPEQDRKRGQILKKVTEIVSGYRLEQMKDLQALEKLATRRRMNGFDRIAVDDNQWASRPLPLTPEQFTQSLWSEVNALKDAISMPRQTVRNLINAIEQGKVSDEEFAILKLLVEKRGREATQVTVTPVDAVQYCSPRPLTPELSPDICVNLENNEGKVDSERDEIESPSAGTGLVTPGQQCHPIWETGRTTADGVLTAGVGSNQGGDTSSPTERVDTRAGTKITTTSAASNTVSLQARSKPQDKKTLSEENK